MDRFFNAEFPPVLNAILLMLLLLSNTFFVFWGFLAVKYDEKECCMDLRKLTFDEKKIVQHQYEWAGIMLSIFLLVSCIACVVLRIMINAKLGSKFEIEISGDLIGRFVLKIVCIVIMAAISLTIGRIIAYLFRNIVIGVILCLVLDQVIVAKSWLMSGFVYRIYNDIDCFISRYLK